MDNLPIIAIILGFLIVFAIIYMVANRKHKRPPRFKVFFIIGITWISLGITTGNQSFWILGIVFTVIGLVNKSKWKDEAKWADLTDSERRLKISLIAGLVVLMAVGIAFYFLNR